MMFTFSIKFLNEFDFIHMQEDVRYVWGTVCYHWYSNDLLV